MFQSPSYHHISPLTRARSNSTSNVRNNGSSYSLYRSRSYSTSGARDSGFTMPSYGYGGGFMARSLSRSNSNLFGRSLSASAISRTAPFHSVAVQRSTPHYSDKYPFVRYSYGNIETGLAILTQTELKSPNLYGIKDTGTKRWLEGKLNAYNTGLFTRPNYKTTVERPIAPPRNYVRYLPVNDAVDLYKNRCMTIGTLSKYFLSPTTYSTRRDKELNISSATSLGRYSGSSPYNRTPYYSRVTNDIKFPTKYHLKNCNSNKECKEIIANSICRVPDLRCVCANGSIFNGKECVDKPIKSIQFNSECNNKKGNCIAIKKPGQSCVTSNECEDAGSAHYFCIANLCQLSPECLPGYISVGAECFPMAVTGGYCIHPVQCLSGSVCIKSKCRGPCPKDEIFVEDTCFKYEGAGCISRSCVSRSCPKNLPSCNYVPQKNDYLCCERSITHAVQCPHPKSIPEINPITRDYVECLNQRCGPGFSCEFSIHGRGSYICCSNPPRKIFKL